MNHSTWCNFPAIAAIIATALAPEVRGVPLEISPPDPRRDATVATVEKVLPSVVNIATTELRQVNDPWRAVIMQLNGQRPVEEGLSVGSGVIMDEAGYVLTADHVVRFASEIWVKLADGRERRADRVFITARTDVALLKIRTRPGDTFKPIDFAADDDLLLGETVIALGNPLGLGTSVSRGILSSKNRRPPPELEPLGPGDWLQTDAAINQGNSGGPLVNLRGELIGLNVAVQPGGEGIAFAIPIRIVTDALAEILTPERISGLWFGAQIKPGRGPGNSANGTVVDVLAGSPAAKAGVQTGDVIQGVNGQAARGFIEMTRTILSASDEKRKLTLNVVRNGARRDITVDLVEEKSFFNAALIKGKTGASVIEMTAEAAQALNLRQPEGLVVTNLEPGSPAAASLRAGSIITVCDGRIVNTVTELGKVLFAHKKGDTVKLDYVDHVRQGGFLIRENKSAEFKVR